MRSEVPFATPGLPVIELARPMSDSLHCVPVLDASRTLHGLITQSDLVAALYQMAPYGFLSALAARHNFRRESPIAHARPLLLAHPVLPGRRLDRPPGIRRPIRPLLPEHQHRPAHVEPEDGPARSRAGHAGGPVAPARA
ncbi:hypothetical protein G6F23_014436 [Rhizopus arrhizus]|nr:hypothetical protein G6F23_014436 [Rhizopus arrhizus]